MYINFDIFLCVVMLHSASQWNCTYSKLQKSFYPACERNELCTKWIVNEMNCDEINERNEHALNTKWTKWTACERNECKFLFKLEGAALTGMPAKAAAGMPAKAACSSLNRKSQHC